MLIQFSVENFRSIKEKAVLSMNSLNRFKENQKNITFEQKHKLNLLKSACIYGSNSSGKSNLIRACAFYKNFILNSAGRQVGDKIEVSGFKFNTETENLPSKFEMDFIIGQVIYRYGFTLDSNTIYEETLYAVYNKKEVTLFERHLEKIKPSPVYFKEGLGIELKTRPNALFLSVVAQFNGVISNEILNWFKAFYVLSGEIAERRSIDVASRGNNKEALIKFIQAADLGIDDVEIEEAIQKEEEFPKGFPESLKKFILEDAKDVKMFKKTSIHKKYDVNNNVVSTESLPFRYESKGTIKIFNMFGYIYEAITQGSPIVIDELESSLHPMIVEWLLGLFNSESNKTNAQLIFATHDTNLLEKKNFRRDQVWFMEKNKYGASELFSLAEFGGKVRKNANFEKEYMFGKYGAIPIVKKFYNVWDRA